MYRVFLTILCLSLSCVCRAQSTLSPHWEELTAADFAAAIHQSKGVCVLPFGIIEKHGPHLPLGTDLLNVRYVTARAAKEEYAVVFPAYYFGQIGEARHQPGTLAYSANMQLSLLQETTDEMGRNGCTKIIIVNGHGGNENLLPYFAQTQMQSPHSYVVYAYWWSHNQPGRPAEHSTVDMHAGESETSHIMVSHPELLHMDRVPSESGADQKRLHLPEGVYTGIWWYARFPNHYAGDASHANLALGKSDMDAWIKGIADVIRAVKADDESLKLQNQFFQESQHPLDTPQ
ncbi:MAG: creatininase family protein [Acidobacteria bacterium]|nr:creatininase family protein [Acidobacteriota bacterium]MBW4044086.1 creatininase family protein [Acidobacteriota bacterium]